MPEFSHPSDIARETLRRLAMRRTPPTPDNYRQLYHEIAGTTELEVFPEKALKALGAALPRNTPAQTRFAQQWLAAAQAKDWTALTHAIRDLVAEEGKAPPPWGNLIKDLLVQWERRHTGLTPAAKRDAVEHVLRSASGEPKNLYERLTGLITSWAKNEQQTDNTSLVGATPTSNPAEALNSTEPDNSEKWQTASADLRELIATLLESGVSMLLINTPDLADEAQSLAKDVRHISNSSQLAGLAKRIKQYAYKLNFIAEDQAEIKQALQNLLMLVIENVTELIADDQWLHGQISMVIDVFGGPLNVRQLDDVERRLKEVIYKQSALKNSLNQAKERLKTMLAGFVDHLASFSESTSEYHNKMEGFATRIGGAGDLIELNNIIEEVMRETRIIQLNAQRSSDDLQEMKSRVEESEREIERLQNELAQTSEMVRHDQLTGALNRKGLDEAFDREVARVRRRGNPMCIALLDVDNFKQLNDSLGHQTGDEALIHLARVIRETMRPNDTLARFGGEEFLVLLPDTKLADAMTALQRLQRELTKRFFMANNQKVLITFSAGITEVLAEEERKDTFARADQAMYQAKREGKNRVVAI